MQKLYKIKSWAVLGFLVTHQLAFAAYDASKDYIEASTVAKHYPDPTQTISTPAFASGKQDFTSQEELMAFVKTLAANSTNLRIRILGKSQEGRDIPLLVFSKPNTALGNELIKNNKPTVLIIGQQHGNEPAGGEAGLALAAKLTQTEYAKVLDSVNVLIVPRANPDGAHHFVRGLKDGRDVNRDHLMVDTPEGKALAAAFVEYQPDVVLDCHEFGVATRWIEKFNGVQSADAFIQYATIANLPPKLTEAAERMFRRPLLKDLESEGFSHAWYISTSYNFKDLKVSMGGVTPDTGRNVAGLKNMISFLIETRGVGIGRAHFKRRVMTHLTAMVSFINSASKNAEKLMGLGRQIRSEVAQMAGQGEIAVLSNATLRKHDLEFRDPVSGEKKLVEVDYNDALRIEEKLKRARPFAYIFPADQVESARKLKLLGVTVMKFEEDTTLPAESYEISSIDASKKGDVRGEDSTPDIIKLGTKIKGVSLTVKPGDFYVPLDQPLANVITTAMEPESNSSYVANRILKISDLSKVTDSLPLWRVLTKTNIKTTVWQSDK